MYVIITRDQCSFCDSAKALLKGANEQYTEYNVQSPSSKWVLSLIKMTNLTTVPQIFDKSGKHIGGYTELQSFLADAEGNV